MPATAAARATSRYDIDGFLRPIGDVPVTTDTAARAAALARLLLVLARS